VMAQAVADVLHEKSIVDRTEVQAYDWRCLFALQKIDPQIKTAYLTDVVQEKLMQDSDPKKAGLWTGGYLLKNYHNSIPEMIHALGGKLWDPQDLELTKKDLDMAHQLGLKVVTWSWVGKYGKEFNKTMVRELVSMGVDGIITDRPDLAEKYVHA
jgi:glycerophosphoryl diester phosphodiesterase